MTSPQRSPKQPLDIDDGQAAGMPDRFVHFHAHPPVGDIARRRIVVEGEDASCFRIGPIKRLLVRRPSEPLGVAHLIGKHRKSQIRTYASNRYFTGLRINKRPV